MRIIPIILIISVSLYSCSTHSCEMDGLKEWQINSTYSIHVPSGYKMANREYFPFEYDDNHITNAKFEASDSTKFITVNVRKSIAPLPVSYLSNYVINSYGKNLPTFVDSTIKGITAFFIDSKTTTGVFFGFVFFDRQHDQLVEIVGMSLSDVPPDPTNYLNCMVQYFLY